jgi:tRNA(fMet)-specific endonuclease VapC
MALKSIVLDTNAYSHYLRGDQKVLDTLAKSEIVYMSIFVLAELLTGFKRGSKEKLNRKWLKTFLDKPTVSILQTSTETVEIFADIKSHLMAKGKPLPIHDIWIAAHTLETGSVLVSYDKHFTSIPGLRIWK